VGGGARQRPARSLRPSQRARARPAPRRRQVSLQLGASLNYTSLASNTTYVLAAGEYTLTTTVFVVSGSPLCIKGAGKGGTVIRHSPPDIVGDSYRVALYANGGSVGLFNLSMEGHTSSAPGNLTGAVGVGQGGRLHAEGVAFRRVAALANGAAVGASSGAALNLTDVDFVDCGRANGSPLTGGAITASGAGTVVDLHGTTTFVRTYAGRGGAVAVDNGGAVRFRGPAFFTNVTVSDPTRWAGGRAAGVRGAVHVTLQAFALGVCEFKLDGEQGVWRELTRACGHRARRSGGPACALRLRRGAG
jgi:hypothetical protein